MGEPRREFLDQNVLYNNRNQNFVSVRALLCVSKGNFQGSKFQKRHKTGSELNQPRAFISISNGKFE